jgi:hypothetical protein
MSASLESNDDSIAGRLREAEPNPGPLPRISASQLMQAAANRRRSGRNRTAAAVLSVGLAFIVTVRSGWNGVDGLSTSTLRESTAQIGPVNVTLADLEHEAAIQQRVVDGLKHAATLRRLRTDVDHAEQPANTALFAQESARSAAISWRYATMVEQGLGDRSAAIREYRRVAERFAGTAWAELAAASLERLGAARTPSS